MGTDPVASVAAWRWTSLVGAGLSARVMARSRVLANTGYWRRHTARLQAAQLRGLLSTARGTEFGRAHGFASLAAISGDADLLRAYRAAVPLADWHAFAAPIERMRLGAEPDVLWPGLVGHFAQTSGTTAGDKFIPVSDAMLRSNARSALDIFAYMRHRGPGLGLSRLAAGRFLFLGGSSALSVSEAGIATGDLSGIVTPMIRWPISAIYSPGPEIALNSHWPSKIEAMARLALDQDIRFISGMPSWALVLMGRVLELAAARGQRATCIRDVWPNLSIFVHGGVNYAPFVSRVSAMVSGDAAVDLPHRLELYPASEGFIAMQDRPGEAGLRLQADVGNFIEFVPLEAIGAADAPACAAHEVEFGQRYVVVLSTCAGLYRYILGDVVEFDDIPAGLGGRGGTGPARLRIVGRHRHFINAFGENIIVEHIERAAAAAAAASGLAIGEFTAGPVYPAAGRPAGLELVFEAVADAEAIARFGRAFDAALKDQNVDYTTKRTGDVGMGPPTLSVVAPGSFHRWMEARGKLGGQHKCPRCANDRTVIEGVKDVAKVQEGQELRT